MDAFEGKGKKIPRKSQVGLKSFNDFKNCNITKWGGIQVMWQNIFKKLF